MSHEYMSLAVDPLTWFIPSMAPVSPADEEWQEAAVGTYTTTAVEIAKGEKPPSPPVLALADGMVYILRYLPEDMSWILEARTACSGAKVFSTRVPPFGEFGDNMEMIPLRRKGSVCCGKHGGLAVYDHELDEWWTLRLENRRVEGMHQVDGDTVCLRLSHHDFLPGGPQHSFALLSLSKRKLLMKRAIETSQDTPVLPVAMTSFLRGGARHVMFVVSDVCWEVWNVDAAQEGELVCRHRFHDSELKAMSSRGTEFYLTPKAVHVEEAGAVVVSDGRNKLCVFDTAACRFTMSIPVERSISSLLCVSRNVMTVHHDGSICVWDVVNGRRESRISPAVAVKKAEFETAAKEGGGSVITVLRRVPYSGEGGEDLLRTDAHIVRHA